MLGVFSIARSGLQAAEFKLAVAAHNLANQQTDGFKQSRAVLNEAPPAGRDPAVGRGVEIGGTVTNPSPGVQINDGGTTRELSNTDLLGNLLDVRAADQLFRTNLEVLRTGDQLVEELLNLARR